jgi:hypothetical protein
MSTSAAEDANIHSSSPFVDDDAKKAQNNNDNNDINDINDLKNLKNLNDLNNFDNLSKAGHVTRISLRTRQDVTQARMRIRSEGSPKHPVLSELEFTFRAVHDKVDSTTLVRIGRTTFHPDPAVGHEGPLINSLGLRGIDKTQKFIPARIRNVFDEVARNGDAWITRPVTIKSRDLQVGGFATMQYYDFFKAIGLRKEGKDWDMADLESVIEFLDYRRGR